MAKEWLIFVENIAKDLPEGREIELTLKDNNPGPRRYENRVVRAIVARSAAQLPGAEKLSIRSWTGVLYPEAWWVKVVAEVGELTPGRPHGESLPLL